MNINYSGNKNNLKMAKVTIIENGPALIEDEEFLLIQSKVFTEQPITKKVAICRCGKSANGVWCDGSHKTKNENNGKSKKD